MVVFGALTARHRARAVPGASGRCSWRWRSPAPPTLVLVVALGRVRARAALPRAGRRDGGRQLDDRRGGRAQPARRRGPRCAARIEATLALGATATQAMLPIVRRSLRSGMIPLIDSTKTTGLIFFPGTMVGMLLAGADPIDAVRLQLILLSALLGSVALAALTATGLAYRTSSRRPTSCATCRPVVGGSRRSHTWRRDPSGRGSSRHPARCSGRRTCRPGARLSEARARCSVAFVAGP